MSREECQEILDILDMYQAITYGLHEIDAEDNLIKHRFAKFSGFDGNNEGQKMLYVQYFIMDLDRYSALKDGLRQRFNSHTKMTGIYRDMLERWKPFQRESKLSRDQISEILGEE
jgi:uncharacterized protein YfbU (UPF0304 family)